MFIKNPGVSLVDNRQFPETSSGSHHFKFILIYIGGRSQRKITVKEFVKDNIIKKTSFTNVWHTNLELFPEEVRRLNSKLLNRNHEYSSR